MKSTLDALIEKNEWVSQAEPMHLFKSLFSAALHLNLPVAIWQLPNTQTIHFLADLSGKTQTAEADLDELPAGFLCSPFENEDVKNNFFIEADLHFVFENEQILQIQNLTLSKEKNERKENFLNTLSHFLQLPVENGSSRETILTDKERETNEKHAFTELVQKAIEAIRTGQMQKVVLSRQKEVSLPENFSLPDAFRNLAKSYPAAFISLIYLPESGIWLGASPERLVSMDKNQIFRTMALAGTQPLNPGKPAEDANWTMKEIEEQALVARYIVNCFKKIRVREYEEDGPKTVSAGNLIHLRTDFSVDTKDINFPQLPSVMLRLLHPTSAVCGMPLPAALAFIKENEQYNRQLYSGFLGPVHISQETHLFVNLRCMQIVTDTDNHSQKALLYAGAGITAHSQPEKEWLETELKCQTLLNVVFIP